VSEAHAQNESKGENMSPMTMLLLTKV